jgi:hypothetical protein
VKTTQSSVPGGEAATGKQSAAATAAAEAAEAAERFAAAALVPIEEIVTRECPADPAEALRTVAAVVCGGGRARDYRETCRQIDLCVAQRRL